MKKRKQTIGIVGHFGGKNEFYDGQTIKTKNLKKIVEKYGEYKTYCVDTFLVKRHKAMLLFKSIKCLAKCKKIVILLSENGMNFYLPFFYCINKIFRRKIYHDIIGSEILQMVDENPRFVKYLNALEQNWFEYQSGVDRLAEKGVKNVVRLPNCKDLQPLEEREVLAFDIGKQFKFCTFSRVIKEKGITDAIEAITEINKEKTSIVATLDVYGEIDDDYREEFKSLLTAHSQEVLYKGKVNSFESVSVIKNYFALLFPTRWKGEGFPGTILDAFASGVPVIASDWNANKELIENEKTGIIYPSESFKSLKDSIIWAIENYEKIVKMRINCREEYEKYTPKTIGSFIISALQG